MNPESVISILQWVLPSGCMGTVIGWLVSRKGRRLDMLGKMQKSIDALTKKYTEVLDENVRLKGDNAALLAQMREMEIKMDMLSDKVDELTEQLKNKNNERNQNYSSGRRTPVRSGRAAKQGGSLPGKLTAGGAVKSPRNAGSVRCRAAGAVRVPGIAVSDVPAGPADGADGFACDDGGALDEDTQLSDN
jgi:TolA-binding protein